MENREKNNIEKLKSISSKMVIIPPETNFNEEWTKLHESNKMKSLPILKPNDRALAREAGLLALLEKLETFDFTDIVKDEEFNAYKQSVDLSEDQKIVIMINHLVETAFINGYGFFNFNSSIYFYSNSFWLKKSHGLICTFLSKAIQKMGYPISISIQPKMQDKYYEQLLTVAFFEKDKEDTTIKINLENGTYRFYGNGVGELSEAKEEDFLRYKLPFSFDPNATSPIFDKFFNRVLPDKECQDVFWEYLGYIFMKDLKLEKILILKGEGANGKSVLFDVIRALLGSSNVGVIPLQRLCEENGQYRIGLENFLLNWAPELGKKITDIEMFKKLVSGEPVDAKQLYKDHVILDNYCRFIFNTNRLLETEQTEAFFRRQLILPFNEFIPEGERDVDLSKKIIAHELSGIFNKILVGVNRLSENRKFTVAQVILKEIENYRNESNNVQLFLNEENFISSTSNKIKVKDLYPQYSIFCKENGYRPLSRNNFTSRLRNMGIKVSQHNQNYFYAWIEKTQISIEEYLDINN